jgi:hypothetical protein
MLTQIFVSGRRLLAEITSVFTAMEAAPAGTGVPWLRVPDRFILITSINGRDGA